jgi:hypothetical protein
MVTQVEFNTKGSNPFYGMQNTLDLYQSASKGLTPTPSKLEAAWNECDTQEKLAVLFSVMFFIGDVTNRQHNIFDGKVDGGGNGQREVFRDTIIPFLATKVRKQIKSKRLALMTLITEYTTMDNILSTRVKTKKGTPTVLSVIDMVNVFGLKDVGTYVAEIIKKGTPFQKMCVAKFVTRPRFSKRSGKSKMLPETMKVMETKAKLLTDISQKTSLPFEDKGSYIDFAGFYNWRKEFNQGFESVLFSSGAVKNMDKEEFVELLEKMPSDARFRVRNRVMFDEKWSKFKGFYEAWESYKVEKQAEQRNIEEKIANGVATQSEKSKLAKVKKEAKVNVGANSFTKMFDDIINGRVDEIKIQPFLDKINLPYNSLVFVDDSGSMNSRRYGDGFSARQFAAFIATIVLSKNPDAEARDMIGLFSNTTRLFNGISSRNTSPNSLMRTSVVKTAKRSLIDGNDTFLNNLDRMKSFLDSQSTYNGTSISSIPETLNRWVNGDDNRLEELQRYPIWTLISDGNFNNSYSAEASLNDFMRRCENYFGFKPYLILIDVAGNSSAKVTQFSGIDNVMVVPPNPANIEMLLTNFKDMDTYDVYTPLLSLSRSNRYSPVRKYVEDNIKV